MATIYSYPEVTRLRGDDVLILSKSKGKKRTYSVSVNKIADHVSGFIELGNNSSAIDFVSDLQDYITIENNVFTISGYATNSSVEAVADSVANLSLTTTSDLNGATAALAISLTAEYTSYIGTELSSYSTTSVVAEQIATATEDLAGAQAFTTLQSQFGTFDEEGNLLYRKDEQRFKPKDDWFTIWVEANVQKPYKWIVWPQSKKKGWLDRIEGIINNE